MSLDDAADNIFEENEDGSTLFKSKVTFRILLILVTSSIRHCQRAKVIRHHQKDER